MSVPQPVIVLAGGRSTRFGTDKLAVGPQPEQAPADSPGLLTELLHGLSSDFVPILVGPARALDLAEQPLTIREDPPGGGPGAGLLAGVRLVRDRFSGSRAFVLAGDAPGGGRALAALQDGLAHHAAAVALDDDGQRWPLPAAFSAAGITRLADTPTSGAGASLRRLLGALDPVAVPVEPAALYDVDTPADLAGWRHRNDPAARELAGRVAASLARRGVAGEAVLVLIDGVGADVLAATLRTRFAISRLPVGDLAAPSRPDTTTCSEPSVAALSDGVAAGGAARWPKRGDVVHQVVVVTVTDAAHHPLAAERAQVLAHAGRFGLE